MFYNEKRLRFEVPLPGKQRNIVLLLPHDVDAADLALVGTFVDAYSKLSEQRKKDHGESRPPVYVPTVWRVPMKPFDPSQQTVTTTADRP